MGYSTRFQGLAVFKVNMAARFWHVRTPHDLDLVARYVIFSGLYNSEHVQDGFSNNNIVLTRAHGNKHNRCTLRGLIELLQYTVNTT